MNSSKRLQNARLNHINNQFPYLQTKSENKISYRFDNIKINSIQPKLKISQPGDAYEQEADRVAEQILGMSTSDSITSLVQKDEKRMSRKCSECDMKKEDMEDERLSISRKPSTMVDYGYLNDDETDEVANEINGSSSAAGSPLDADTKEFMQSRFGGYDFSKVRIHTDSHAEKSASEVNARAYTTGQNIVFAKGEYSPNTTRGRLLLAHELIHVIQQTNSTKAISRPMPLALDASKSERYLQPLRLHFDFTPIPEGILQRQFVTPIGAGGGYRGLIERERQTVFDPNRPPRQIPSEEGEDLGMSEQPVGTQLLAGAIIGDFNEDQSFWTATGQVIVGFIPFAGQVADVRDLLASLNRIIFQGKSSDPWEWLNFILVLIGLIPGLGDIIKGAGRFGLRWLRESRLVGRIVRWLEERLVRPTIEAIAPIIQRTIAWLKRQLTELLNRIQERIRRLTGREITEAEQRAARAERRYRGQLEQMIEDAEQKAARRGGDIMDNVHDPINRSWIQADPRHRELAFDPAHRSFSDQSVAEAKAALTAERQGIGTAPFRRDLTGGSGAADFVDTAGVLWDVFSPRGINIAEDVDSIYRKLKVAGQNVIFDAQYISPVKRYDIMRILNEKLIGEGQQDLLQRIGLIGVGFTEAERQMLRTGRISGRAAVSEPEE
jgi:Domain of unknown function (DUF4157)